MISALWNEPVGGCDDNFVHSALNCFLENVLVGGYVSYKFFNHFLNLHDLFHDPSLNSTCYGRFNRFVSEQSSLAFTPSLKPSVLNKF